jgi:5-methylcytosine-specific restriction endonuclease McrA
MLFAYTYVPHAMEKMQEFIDFIFFEVWCKAPIGLAFSLDLFENEPDLRGVLSAFGFTANAPERGKQFYKDIKAIYELFAPLTPEQIDQLKQWYQSNNDIEKVCANDPVVQIARYADIAAIHPDLSQQLASFFKGLYSQQLLDLAALREKIGQIDEHYQAFMQTNTTGKCPFCGLGDIKGVHHTRREAYDHYLPKALYPFNSINFRNLAPACHECNSTYKLSRDPAHNVAGRRKAFYPYTSVDHGIEITVDLNNPDIDRLTPADIQLTFGPDAVHEEVETWKEVYGIDERYKAKCCDGDAKDWLEQLRILRDAHGITPNASLATVQQQTAKAPVANSNFLKRAFLEGCQRAGLFDAIATEGAAP